MRDVASRFDVSYGTIRNWVSEFCRCQDSSDELPFFRKSSVGDHPEYYRGFAWFHIRGSADYTTSNRASQDALYQAKLAADQDIVVHTLCVGAGADTDFLEAIAKISGGYDIVVPGGTSVSTMVSNLREAFGVLAVRSSSARASGRGPPSPPISEIIQLECHGISSYSLTNEKHTSRSGCA